MNRLSSVLAGAAVSAVSGAVIAAAAVGQGVFSGGPTKPAEQDTAQVANVATEAPEAAAEAATPQIVYIDKVPIYITRTIVQPIGDSPTPTATPTPKSTQFTSTGEQPRPAATQPTATQKSTESRTGDDHEGSHSGMPTSGTIGRTSGHDD